MAFDPSTIADAKKRTYTVDAADVDSAQSGFPVPLVFSVANGNSEMVDDLAPDIHPDTVLLIESFNEPDGSTTFVDSSPGGHTLTSQGATHHETDLGIFSSSSIHMDGNADWIDLGADSDYNLSNNDWTMRAWIYLAAYATDNNGFYQSAILTNDITSKRCFAFTVEGTSSSYTSLSFLGFSDNTSGYTNVTGSYSFALNTLYHVEAVRSGNLVYLFVDGTLLNTGGTAFSRTIQDSTAAVQCGRLAYGSGYNYYFPGHMQSVQLINGTGLHTEDFTPPNRLLSVPTYKKLSVEQGGTQLPVEVVPGEWDIVTYGDDVCTGGTASASSIYSSTYNADKAFDDNDTTRWSALDASLPQWIKYDLGSGVTKKVKKVSIKAYVDTGARVDDFKIQGSNNDTDWDDLLTSNHPNTSDVTEHVLTSTDNYRYYRLYITSTHDAGGATLYEFTLHEWLPQAVIHTNPDLSDSADSVLTVSWDETQDDNTTYVGLTGTAVTDIFSPTVGSLTAASANYNRRIYISTSLLTAHAGKIRIKFLDDSVSISECWIYKQASSGDAWDAETDSGVQITKGGLTSFSITSADRYSDPIDFEVTGSDDLIVAMHNTTDGVRYTKPANTDCWWKSGSSEASTENVTGYTTDSNFVIVEAIEGVPPNWTVWDSNFAAVYHMAQDPSGGTDCILDSTANANQGTPIGSMVSGDLVDSPIGKGLDFNGSSQAINLGDILDSVFDGSLAQFTIVATANASATTSNPSLVSKYYATGDQRKFQFYLRDNVFNRISFYYGIKESTQRRIIQGDTTLSTDTDYVFALTFDATEAAATDQVGLYVDGEKETNSVDLSSGSIPVMQDNTAHLGIGAALDTSGGFGTNGFPGLIGEVRISSTVRSADWIALTNLALTDTLGTWAAYSGGGGAEILQYWDQLYGDPPNTEHTVYWDHSYAVLNYIVKYFDQVYGIQLQRYWDHSYGNSPLVKVFWDLLYGDQKLITKFWDLDYSDRAGLIQYWDQKYNIRKAIQAHWDQRYTILGKEISTYWDQAYDVKSTNPLMKFFDQYYHIVADSVVESAALGFYINGIKFEGPFHVSWELNIDSYKNTGEMQFNYPAPFFEGGEGNPMRIVDTDIDLHLECTIPTKSERTSETIYVIKAESKTAVLERANVFTETFSNTTAETIVTTIAARHGITIDWQIPDFPIGEYGVNDQTPLNAIRGLTGDNCAKAALQTSFDGNTLSVIKRMESDSHMWDVDTPSYYITDSLHLEQTNQRGEYKKGYNMYRVTDQASSSEIRTWLEDDEYADAKRLVKCYRVPWDGTSRSLYTSDNNATIQYLGVVTEDLTEEFSIVNGEGEGKTSKPAYAVVSWLYNDISLGTPTVTEEGVVQTPTSGTTMLTLTYTTKYYKWIVTDYDDPKIQIWVE